MKVVILCGGLGTRISEETSKIPKPMVKIGQIPILVHIMRIYKKFGFKLAGKRKKYYQKTGEDALIFWRSDLAKPSFLESLTHWQGQIQSQLSEQNCILEEEL